MEKIININFQSRVIAIEESAYNELKQYTDSLRRHFANEESHEEIINDIENRIAELLAARLKQGANCINVTDLNAVIDSIGRIEDIKAAEEEGQQGPRTAAPQSENVVFNDRFHRNEDDKIIAGVCSGIAERMQIDTTLVRVLFVILIGALFWIYILLWIIVPSQSSSTHITRRLFRNPDKKVIAGVCSGLAVYFRTDAWKMRLVFVLPLIISTIFSGRHSFYWDHHAPDIFIGSFSGTTLVLYIILWISIPYASSATDRMEMRGEKIDINSIKAATQARAGSAPQPSRSAGSGIGHVVGILFKAFFLLIAGSIALGLFGALIGVVFAGTVAMPFTDFLLNGWQESALTWTGIVLTLSIPFLALIVWLIRRTMGVRTQRHYLGYVFAVLWIIGVTCSLIMAGTITRNFSVKSIVEEEVQIQQPSVGRLYINVSSERIQRNSLRYSRWFGDWDEEEDMPFHIISKDSLWLNTVKVNIEQSRDSLYHVYKSSSSRANTTQEAKQLAGHVMFNIESQDSIVSLPRGFTISSKDKFRNQQVLITVEVPLGKTVQVSKDINEYSWFTINTDGNGHYRHGRYNHRWNDRHGYDNDRHGYGNDREYIMTANGLKKKYDTVNSHNDDSDY